MLSASYSSREKPGERFVVQRGMNISHWLSQVYSEEAVRTRFFQEQDVLFLKQAGFDHIRLPVDEVRLWEIDGSPISKSWDELHRAIGWCEQQDLRVIVDLHIVRAHYFNAEFDGARNTLFTDPNAQTHFLHLWAELSGALRTYPNHRLAYELLNEAVAPNPDDWNQIVRSTIQQIRTTEPDRILVIGSNEWQSPETFRQLDIPENDPNLMLSFHLYSPFPVTHYKAKWTSLHAYDGAIRYPGKPVDEVVFEQDYPEATRITLRENNHHHDEHTQLARIEIARSVAHKLGLPLYCGEFGCLPSVPRDLRLRWYRDAIHVMSSNHIAYAAWDYKGDFGIIDRDTGDVDLELTAILADTK